MLQTLRIDLSRKLWNGVGTKRLPHWNESKCVSLSSNSLHPTRQMRNQVTSRVLQATLNRFGTAKVRVSDSEKRIVRALIREIIVNLDEPAGEINLVIHWQGGIHTKLMVPRRRRGKATATSSDAIEAVRSLANVCTDTQIAGVLNRNGLLTGRGNRFTKERVCSLRNSHGIANYGRAVGTAKRQGYYCLVSARFSRSPG